MLVPAARARIAVWRDARTLWTDTLEQQPQLAFGWAQLARYYRDSHDLPGAERALRRTLELAPGSCDTRFNIGLVLFERGALTEAQRETEQLLTLCPDSSDSHRLMASIRAGLGDHASP